MPTETVSGLERLDHLMYEAAQAQAKLVDAEKALQEAKHEHGMHLRAHIEVGERLDAELRKQIEARV